MSTVPTLQARRCAAASVFASCLLAACGGGGDMPMPSPTPPAPTPAATSDADAPLPFWAGDAPVRPSLQHLFGQGAGGGVVSLSGRERSWLARPVEERRHIVAASPLALAVQRRPVTGLYADTYHTASGATTLAQDLSGFTVEAIAPDGSGGFERIAATARRPDGSYLIDGVPEGGHWVRIGSTYVWTAGNFVDWGVDTFGRTDTAYAANPTPLTINALQLAPWQSHDRLAWTVPMQGFSFALPLTNTAVVQHPPAPGDTALGNFGLEFGPDPSGSFLLGLLSASKGDQAYLNQLGGSSAGDYRTLVRSLVLPALEQADGTPASVTSGFLDIAQGESLRLRFDRPAYAARQAEVHPAALGTSNVVALSTSALATGYGVPADAYSLFEFDTFGSSDLNFGRIAYGSPFPAAWPRILESYHGFTVRYLAPGATVALPVERFLYAAELLPAGADPSVTLRPRMSPVRNAQVNGRSLFDNQLAVGSSPHIAWQAPAVGTPDRYLVTVRRLFANGPRSESRTVGRFYTGQTQLDLPPGVLQPGQVYFLTISAIAAGSPVSAPARSQLPYAFATLMSAIFSP
jgi:hypothetical protein